MKDLRSRYLRTGRAQISEENEVSLRSYSSTQVKAIQCVRLNNQIFLVFTPLVDLAVPLLAAAAESLARLRSVVSWYHAFRLDRTTSFRMNLDHNLGTLKQLATPHWVTLSIRSACWPVSDLFLSCPDLN